MDNNELLKILSNIISRLFVTDNSYNVCYFINGLCIDSIIYYKLNNAIRDSTYYLKSLTHKVDQIKIYKNGILIAELNK